jgi:hypothetical protein
MWHSRPRLWPLRAFSFGPPPELASRLAGHIRCRPFAKPGEKGGPPRIFGQIKIWDSISSMVYRPTIRQDICFVLLPLRNPFTGYFEQIIKQAALQAGITAVKAERYLRYSCCNPRHMGTNMAVPSCHCALRGENFFRSALIRVHQR